MIQIFTFSQTRPDFIELQLRSFAKYLKEDFQFTVFNNDAFNKSNVTAAECKKLGLECIDVERDSTLEAKCNALEPAGSSVFDGSVYRNINVACGYSLCWSWENVISKKTGNVCILHSDVFLVEPIRLSDALADADIRYFPQRRISFEYMWEALVIANMDRLPVPETMNWFCGLVDGINVDVGGQTSQYIKDHPDVRRKHLQAERFNDGDETGYEMFYVDGVPVLHYLRGSNWNKQSSEYHRLKTEWLKNKI